MEPLMFTGSPWYVTRSTARVSVGSEPGSLVQKPARSRSVAHAFALFTTTRDPRLSSGRTSEVNWGSRRSNGSRLCLIFPNGSHGHLFLILRIRQSTILILSMSNKVRCWAGCPGCGTSYIKKIDGMSLVRIAGPVYASLCRRPFFSGSRRLGCGQGQGRSATQWPQKALGGLGQKQGRKCSREKGVFPGVVRGHCVALQMVSCMEELGRNLMRHAVAPEEPPEA